MKLHLYSNDESFGEIILDSGSKHTKEFRGMLLANEKYFKHRYAIREYFSDLMHRPTKGIFWKLLNKLDKKGKKVTEEIKGLDLKVGSDKIILTNTNSKILIHDTLQRTNKGNWFIQIDVLNLNIPKDFPEFELFQARWMYPAPIGGIIGVMKDGKLILEY